MSNVKKVLYIGNYPHEDYSRNFIFIEGLRRNGVEVDVINANYKRRKLLNQVLLKLHSILKKNYDIIIYHSMLDSILFVIVKIVAVLGRIPLVNDMFVSTLLTYYYDRDLDLIKRKRFIPKWYYWLKFYLKDYVETHISNFIISDTKIHGYYLKKQFNIRKHKIHRIFVGARDDLYIPSEHTDNPEFIVAFWGSFIKLQGVKFIIKAFDWIKNNAKQEKMKLVLIGGRTKLKIKNLSLAKELKLKNVEDREGAFFTKFPKILNMINIDVGLGIFGSGLKTQLVIPNKVFEGCALQIPMITCDSPAIRELFHHKNDIYLCQAADPKSLAKAIIDLKNDSNLRKKLTNNAYSKYKEYCTIEKIGKELKLLLESIKSKL